MRWRGRRTSANVEDRRGRSGGFPVGRRGAGLGCGGLVIIILLSMLFGADPQQANEAPRWRSNPDGSLLIEDRYPEKTIAALKAKGHDVRVQESYAPIMGSSQMIMIDRENGVLQAGADPRRQAYAIGK